MSNLFVDIQNKMGISILFQLIMYFTGEQDFFDGIISSLIIFPLVGILFGYFLWHSKYKKERNN